MLNDLRFRQLWFFVLAPLVLGCNLNKFAADQAGSIAVASSGHMRGFWDFEIARPGTAAAIMQLEAMHSVTPDNEQLTLTLASAYVGYAFSWVELDLEHAEDAGRFDEADRLRHRAELLYTRARDLALGAMRRRDDGIDKMLLAKPAELERYLRDHYDDPKDDVAPVFWAASAWGSILNLTEDMGLVADLPTVRTLIEHSARLDPGFEMAAALQFLGGFYAQFPAQFGGSPEKGKEYFEQALKLTGRRAHLVQVNYARLYALTVNDKPLFLSLLREVIASDDLGGDVRLPNKMARMRAELLLSKADRLL